MDAGRKWPETRGLTLSGAGVSACPSSVRSEQSRPVPWSAYSWAVTVMLAIVGPLIALAGVVAGLWLGQRQWKAEQARKDAEEAREQRDTFIENERRAYSGLWELTARTQEEMRGALEALTPQRFSGLLADLNAYMLREGLYIERQDRFLTIEYLFWVNEYFRILATSDRSGDLLTTMAHEGLDTQVALLDEMLNRANGVRNALRARIRDKLGAPDSSAWDDGVRPSDELIRKLEELNEHLAASRGIETASLAEPPEAFLSLEVDEI